MKTTQPLADLTHIAREINEYEIISLERKDLLFLNLINKALNRCTLVPRKRMSEQQYEGKKMCSFRTMYNA